MDGLNLEPLLRLLQWDWRPILVAMAALVAVVAAVRLGWPSRRILQLCLVLSVLVHATLIGLGRPWIEQVMGLGVTLREVEDPEQVHVQIEPWVEPQPGDLSEASESGASQTSVAAWDRPLAEASLPDRSLSPERSELPGSLTEPVVEPLAPRDPLATARIDLGPIRPPSPELTEPVDRMLEPLETDRAEWVANEPVPIDTDGLLPALDRSPESPTDPGSALVMPEDRLAGQGRIRRRPTTLLPDEDDDRDALRPSQRPPLSLPSLDQMAQVDPSDPGLIPGEPGRRRDDLDDQIGGSLADSPILRASLEPGESELPAVAAPAPVAAARELILPQRDLSGDLRRRPETLDGLENEPIEPRARDPIALARIEPDRSADLPPLIEPPRRDLGLTEVPEVYRQRLNPDRSELARRQGATPASERAVTLALQWLAAHQDADGRWDAGVARYRDGRIAPGQESHTKHCPPGEICFGESHYWEADTAVTGLALLAFLGAGHTHQAESSEAQVVERGLGFLLREQKENGDLRGRSRSIGLYGHSMATLALCEAYALTGDPRLADPVRRAVAFLDRSQARDGTGWRYYPAAELGDTSVLGWVVMALKSAEQVGIPITPKSHDAITGWLDRVRSGMHGGLARYQPGKPVTPTMTAEAWVCRQFLGLAGRASRDTLEASNSLLKTPPQNVPFNLYYLYYGTLAMYQQGGLAWQQWNRQSREVIIDRQRQQGHMTGSWDPDESTYGAYGGRVYSTAMAALCLEVYYRYLRLYQNDDPGRSQSSTVNRSIRSTARSR